MSKNFDEIFDECIDRINSGERPEQCLASHPEYAEELEPALRTLLDVRDAYSFVPSASAKMKAKRRFQAVLVKLEQGRVEQPPALTRPFGWSWAWIAVAVVLVVAVIGYFGLKPVLFPIEPAPRENFVFLISDEVNAIGDFRSLNVTISKIGLQQEGEASQWIELNPQVEVVDLTLLQGDNATEIWNGYVEPGEYTKVFIHVDNVTGILDGADGGEADVKLPSEKLQISKPFTLSPDLLVSFVFDITVVKAGESGQYILKPQVGQSGADQKFKKIE